MYRLVGVTIDPAAPRAHPLRVGFVFSLEVGVSFSLVIFFYVDDGGDPYRHHEPLLEGETPLFCLSAVALHSSRWRELDRALLSLKRTYFSSEMTAFAAKHPDMRPEHYEIKGRDLFKPSNARNRRSRVFATKVLRLARNLDVRLFSAIWRKEPNNPVDSMSMYTQSLQIMVERFHYHCTQVGDQGIIVADARQRNLDFQVAASHLSFIFGHPAGRNYTSLTEAPMFVDSILSAGIQFADLLGGCIYGYYYQRKCSAVPGLFNDRNPLTPTEFSADPAGPWTERVPARDYQHCQAYWSDLEALQFRRTDVPAPRGSTVSGFYGFREVM